MGNFLWND
jgi:hypothetical protein